MADETDGKAEQILGLPNLDDQTPQDLREAILGIPHVTADGEVTSTSPFGSPFTSPFRSPFQDVTT